MAARTTHPPSSTNFVTIQWLMIPQEVKLKRGDKGGRKQKLDQKLRKTTPRPTRTSRK